VPRASYSYQPVEDTAFPKKYIMTYSEQEVRKAMEKTLRGIQEINLEKLAKEINAEGKKLDILKLHKELMKAIENVDWKKVNADVQSSLSSAEDELLQDHEELRMQVEKHQKERVITPQKLKKTEENIIRSRLEEQECIKENNLKNKNELKSKKKVIYI
jgi:hypothetical protein